MRKGEGKGRGGGGGGDLRAEGGRGGLKEGGVMERGKGEPVRGGLKGGVGALRRLG